MTSSLKKEVINLSHSQFYRRMILESQEISKHKWLESEKKGSDVGFDRALIDWIIKRSTGWRGIKIN